MNNISIRLRRLEKASENNPTFVLHVFYIKNVLYSKCVLYSKDN